MFHLYISTNLLIIFVIYVYMHFCAHSQYEGSNCGIIGSIGRGFNRFINKLIGNELGGAETEGKNSRFSLPQIDKMDSLPRFIFRSMIQVMEVTIMGDSFELVPIFGEFTINSIDTQQLQRLLTHVLHVAP